MQFEPPKRVVIFDDSKDALIRFATILTDKGCELQLYRRPTIDADLAGILVSFYPHLIVVDLVLGESREDGYNLIRQLAGVPGLKDVPIVVCSKLITETPMGQAEKKRLQENLRVKGAFGKIPDFPSADEILSYAL